MSAIPCLAFQKRKEVVEKQIREHNQAKQSARASGSNTSISKCPIQHLNKPVDCNESNQDTSNPTESVSKTDINKSEQHEKTLEALDLNKKVVVSIQTNEEKQNENLLSN
jgi:hypothetical protein